MVQPIVSLYNKSSQMKFEESQTHSSITKTGNRIPRIPPNHRITLYSKQQGNVVENSNPQLSISKKIHSATEITNNFANTYQKSPQAQNRVQIALIQQAYEKKFQEVLKQNQKQIQKLQYMISSNQKFLLEKDQQISILLDMMQKKAEADRQDNYDLLLKKIADLQTRIYLLTEQCCEKDKKNRQLQGKIDRIQKFTLKLFAYRIKQLQKKMLAPINSYSQKLSILEKSIQSFSEKSLDRIQHTSPMKISFGLKEKPTDNLELQKLKDKMQIINNGYNQLKIHCMKNFGGNHSQDHEKKISILKSQIVLLKQKVSFLETKIYPSVASSFVTPYDSQSLSSQSLLSYKQFQHFCIENFQQVPSVIHQKSPQQTKISSKQSASMLIWEDYHEPHEGSFDSQDDDQFFYPESSRVKQFLKSPHFPNSTHKISRTSADAWEVFSDDKD